MAHASIKSIDENELRFMSDSNGLVFKASDDVQNQLDSINALLTQKQVLLNGTTFNEAYVFYNKNKEKHILLLLTNDVHINLHMRFYFECCLGGMSLSEYVDSFLDGFIYSIGVKQKYYSDGSVLITPFTVNAPANSILNSFQQSSDCDIYIDFFKSVSDADNFVNSNDGINIQKSRLKIRQNKVFPKQKVN